MNFFKPVFIALIIFAGHIPLHAADAITVNSMNYPAWVERGERRTALWPGMEIRQADVIKTGSGGRLLIEMADGSALKLGSEATFVVNQASYDEEVSVLDAAFDALKGAFRFTSSFFSSEPTTHDVSVKIGSITAGIRGTDIWGRSNAEQDLVCLIEGAIDVDSVGQPRTQMTEALTFYVRPVGADPLPVDNVDSDKLAQWATETELANEAGIATQNGAWGLVLMSLTNQAYAIDSMNAMDYKGFPVNQYSVDVDGQTYHRLILEGFESASDAKEAASQISAHLEIDNAWPIQLEEG